MTQLLSLTTTAPDVEALWVEYQRLITAADIATKTTTLAYSMLKRATTDEDRARLREQVSMLGRHQLVLSAHVSAFRAAWLFASYGTDSLFLDAAQPIPGGAS